jgi:hypothetical protein
MGRSILTGLLLLLAGGALEAQAIREWTLTGRLVGPDGRPIAGAVVRATQGPRTLVARTDAKGAYRVAEMGEGRWTVAVRQVGFRPAVDTLTFDPKGMRRDFTLEQLTASLDAVLISERWSGVRGVVGDIRYLRPLAGARIEAYVGSDTVLASGIEGTFALPLAPNTKVVLSVERDGYERQLVSATVPASGYVELDVALDTLRGEPRNWIAWQDLKSRLRYATPRSALVGREELGRYGASSLDFALRESGELVAKGIMPHGAACLFVNGVARPGFPVWSVPVEQVELVEVYPAGSDLSGTLGLRWPPRGECGGGGPLTAGQSGVARVDGSRRSVDPGAALYVVVWTKAQ